MIPTVEPLSALKRLPRNAKAHALTDLRSGMKRMQDMGLVPRLEEVQP